MEPHQLDLFSDSEIRFAPAGRPDTLLMDSEALVRWKSQIFDYQQRVRESKLAQQGTLFDIALAHCDPDKIDPFTLPLQSTAFWRWPADSPGSACLYFVIDNAVPLLLYIGETSRSSLRWKGTHDTKRYLSLYQGLHYRYGLQTAVNIAFWWNAPVERKPRQQLEQALIQKWKPPFNKEMCKLWGRPFG